MILEKDASIGAMLTFQLSLSCSKNNEIKISFEKKIVIVL